MIFKSTSRIAHYGGSSQTQCSVVCHSDDELMALETFIKNYDPPPQDRTLCGVDVHVADNGIEVGQYLFPRRTGAARNLANYVTECADWLDRNKEKTRD